MSSAAEYTRTQVWTRQGNGDGEFGLVDVLASARVNDYTYLIHKQDNGFTATFAPVGRRIGVYRTIEEVGNQLNLFHPGPTYSILLHLAEYIPFLSGEEGIQTTGWQAREWCRLQNGDYRALPKISALAGLDYPEKHWLHMSVDKTDADFVSYTPSEAYGVADRQVRLKFGKYLRKTFPKMSDANIQKAVTELRAKLMLADSPSVLAFATDREKINEIFETEMYPADSDTSSCMHGKFGGQDVRPYHVYADSPDVAVAYMLDLGEIVARSVVSTKDKRWIRCYSTEQGGSARCQAFKDLLSNAGYTYGSLAGNRLTKLPGGAILPYLDGGARDVACRGKFWLVVEDGDGEYTADQTDGSATENEPRCERCDEYEDDCACVYCECCQESYRDGCDTCRTCPECDGCREHGNCSCPRCPHCDEIISPRYVSTEKCDCERCGECGELKGDCECPEETPSAPSTSAPSTEEVTA